MSGRESQTGIMAKFNRNFYLAGCFVVANFVFNRIASDRAIEEEEYRTFIEFTNNILGGIYNVITSCRLFILK